MIRGAWILRGLLLIQVLLCVAVAVADRVLPCGSCGGRPSVPAFLGIVFYSALLLRCWRNGPTPDVFAGILFGAGTHAALMVQMLMRGPFCGLCLSTAIVSACLVVGSVVLDRTNLGRLAVVAPAAALLVTTTLTSVLPLPVKPLQDHRVLIQAFTQPDCSYCDQLERDVLPLIEREFAGRVTVELRPADDLPNLRRTPTLLLRSPAGSGLRVIEGLPTLEHLRGVIRDLETTP